jgi:hypothetical protein
MNLINITQLASERKIKATMSADLIKAIPRVAQSAIFSIESNWKLVSFIFKNTNNNKRLVSSFRTFSAEKTINLKTGMLAGDQFELHKIIISKTNRQFLVIKKNEIPSGLDFALSDDEVNFNPITPIPDLIVTRDFSQSAPSGWIEQFKNNSTGNLPVVQNGFLEMSLYGQQYLFNYAAYASELVKARFYFDKLSAYQGLNFQWKSNSETYSNNYSLSSEDMTKGYFEITVITGFVVGTSFNAGIFISSTLEADKSLKISKIELGGI